jgi:hypothetical protein
MLLSSERFEVQDAPQASPEFPNGRRAPEDEVVRVTLQDRVGKVLLRGK